MIAVATKYAHASHGGAEQARRDNGAQPPAALGVGFVVTFRRRYRRAGQCRCHD